MHLECQSVVDYLFQQRKPTKQNSKGVTLFRNGQSQICIAIGKPDLKNAVTFKLEESLSKIYSGFVHEGKCTIELKLAGGSCANVIISKCNPTDLAEFVKVLNQIDQNPDKTSEIDLRQFSSKSKKDDNVENSDSDSE